MAERGYGRVINIASVHGLVASANKAPYVASKVRAGGAQPCRGAGICGGGHQGERRCHGELHLPRLDRNRDHRAADRGPRRPMAGTGTSGSPTCWPRNNRAAGPPTRRRSARWRCGSARRWPTTSPARRSRSTGAGRRNRRGSQAVSIVAELLPNNGTCKVTPQAHGLLIALEPAGLDPAQVISI
jgi:hypothetical protein